MNSYLNAIMYVNIWEYVNIIFYNTYILKIMEHQRFKTRLDINKSTVLAPLLCGGASQQQKCVKQICVSSVNKMGALVKYPNTRIFFVFSIN